MKAQTQQQLPKTDKPSSSSTTVTCPTTLEEIPIPKLNFKLSPNDCVMSDLIKRARIAQNSWKNTTFSQRAKHIIDIKKLLISHKNEVARAICLDAGKTPVDAMGTEILPGILCCDWYAANAQKYLKEERFFFNSFTKIFRIFF